MKTTKKKTTKKKKEKVSLKENKLKAILAKKEMSQQELADLVGTNRPHICRIVNGITGKCVSLPLALKIAKALKTPVEEIFILDDK